MLKLLAQSQVPGRKTEVLIALAYKYTTIYPDSSLYYLAQAEKLAQQTQNPVQMILVLNHQGLAYYDKGYLAKALEYFKKSLELAQNHQKNDLIARNLGNLGLLYLSIGNNRLALYYYRQALQIFEKSNLSERVALTLSNIGNAYIDMNEYDSANYFVQKALPLTQKHAPLFESFARYNSGKIALYRRQFALAQNEAQRALQLAQKYADKQDLSAAHLLLAQIYLAQNQLDKALAAAQQSVGVAEASQRKRDIYMAYSLYSKLWAMKKQFEQAYRYRNLATMYQDSLQTENIGNALQVFEYEKKQDEVLVWQAQQAQKSSEYRRQISLQQTFIAGALLVLLAVIAIALIILKSRQQIKQRNTQIQRAYQEIQEKQEEIVAQNEELRHQQEEIYHLNTHLEGLVAEKTATIMARNTQLSEYAHFNAHKLRAPIATILGLYEILKLNPSETEQKFIIEQIQTSIILLDEMVKKSQSLLDEDDDDIVV
ncbi:MAG: tetratricopeptide repeat protein [Microscillaceae bacterium]|nr:tetratricopeptide repeat protein [Microscillaceae bacterium]